MTNDLFAMTQPDDRPLNEPERAMLLELARCIEAWWVPERRGDDVDDLIDASHTIRAIAGLSDVTADGAIAVLREQIRWTMPMALDALHERLFKSLQARRAPYRQDERK